MDTDYNRGINFMYDQIRAEKKKTNELLMVLSWFVKEGVTEANINMYNDVLIRNGLHQYRINESN